jgi:hypothetical protein
METRYKVTIKFLQGDGRYHYLVAFPLGAENAVTFTAVQCAAAARVTQVEIVRLKEGRDQAVLLCDDLFQARILARLPVCFMDMVVE